MLRNTAEPYPISIHSLHTEGDLLQLRRPQWICYFNPLPPHGGRQDLRRNPRSPAAFQSTPSTRRETRANSSFCVIVIFQSTPSTRRETVPRCNFCRVNDYFNPLPPHGGRHASFCLSPCTDQFQSTPSTRRETSAGDVTGVKISISSHSLHTEGDLLFSALPTPCSISIHSLHTEGDKTEKQLVVDEVISIHSLHTEGDAAVLDSLDSLRYFNPLPPHGGRQ